MMTEAGIAVVKILALFSSAFVITLLWTPLLTGVLYKYKLGKNIRHAKNAPVFQSMHQHKQGTPTMGGVLIWGTTLGFALLCAVLPRLFPHWVPQELNFITRSETLLPLGALIMAALLGIADDLVDIFRAEKGKGGITMPYRIALYSAIAAFVAYWFVWKLDWTIVRIPLVGNLEAPVLLAFALFFFLIVATAFSVNETDGLDGLAGGVLLSAFIAFACIAFMQDRFQLATFCAVISGALMAFLWFNIHPARFFMGDTGSMSLGVTLAIVAIYTNTVWLLPMIGLILVLESASVIVQVTSKTLRNGKKIFRSTPIHHHFEAIGWPEPKIVMRFWIIAAFSSALGIILFMIERSLVDRV